jgi:hypothetical protein
MFFAALALLKDSAELLPAMFVSGGEEPLALGSRFLDVTLLVLMIVELAYTVVLSLRGRVLVPEPFLIVGLIAVIRRILVITIGQVDTARSTPRGGIAATAPELAVLTGVVVAFVLSIFLLRLRPPHEAVREDDSIQPS